VVLWFGSGNCIGGGCVSGLCGGGCVVGLCGGGGSGLGCCDDLLLPPRSVAFRVDFLR